MPNLFRLTKFTVVYLIIMSIALLYPSGSFAQYRITGSVRDSSGRAVNGASVSIIEHKTESALFFSKTDINGNFSFWLSDSLDEKKLSLRIVSIGYEKAIIPITDRVKSITCIITTSSIKLPNVTVVSSDYAVKIKSDTLSYTATSFSSKSDRVLNDVIKRIPGIEIGENNIIKYMGVPINHLYIDGDDMFDTKYQQATTSIPWNIVNRIEIIPDNQHVKMLNGIIPSYAPGINITIKDQNKINIINSVELSAGEPSILKTEINNLSFKPRLKFVNLFKYDNSGIDITKAAGIQDGGGDFVPSPENHGISLLLTPPTGNTPELEKKRYFNNYSTLATINDFIKTKREVSWKLNAHFILEDQNQITNSFTNYILPFDTVSYTQFQKIHVDRSLFRASATVSINTKQRYLTNISTIDANKVSGMNDINTGYSDVQTLTISNPIKLSNTFTSIHLLRNKKFFELFSLISYERKPQSLLVVPGTQKQILTRNTDYLSSKQSVTIPAFFTNTYISYKTNFDAIFQTYKVGYIVQNADLNSFIYVDPLAGTIQPSDSLFTNELVWQKNKIYLESNFIIRKKNMVINLTIPVSYNLIKYKNHIDFDQTKWTKFMIVPDMRLEYKLGKDHLIHAGYRYNTSFSGMNELYSGIVMKDFQTFTSNNVPMQESHTRSANLGIDLKKPLKLWYVNFSYFYSERSAQFIRSTILLNKLTTSVAIPFKNNSYWSSLSLNISKNIPELKTQLSGGYSYQHTRSFELQNNFLFPINTSTHYLSTYITIKPVNIISLSLSSKTRWIRIRQFGETGQVTTTQTLIQSYNSVDCHFFPKSNITFSITGDQVHLTRSGQKIMKIVFVDASLRYTLSKRNVTLELSARNISNQNVYTDIYSSGNISAATKYELRPRMIFCSASFAL